MAGAGLAAAAGVARVAVGGKLLSELEAHVQQGWFEDGRYSP